MIKPSKIYKMRIVFRLAADAPGRADIVGTLRHMIMTSGLPFARAKQNPNVPRIAYGPSVKRGQFAAREYVDIYLFSSVSASKAQAQLVACQPQGFTILDAQRVPFTLAGVQQLADVAAYEVNGDFASYAPKQTFENYISAPRLEVTQQAENGMSFTRDIKPFVHSAQTLGPDKVLLKLRRVAEKWINPLEVICAWLGIEVPVGEEETGERFIITRQGLYWTDSENNLHLI